MNQDTCECHGCRSCEDDEDFHTVRAHVVNMMDEEVPTAGHAVLLSNPKDKKQIVIDYALEFLASNWDGEIAEDLGITYKEFEEIRRSK